MEFLFHHKEMVTDELVGLRRAVYRRPGFLRAITNTLVLQDPEVRKDFAWDPAWVGRDHRADAAAVDRPRPTGGLDEAAMLLDWLPDARLHVIEDAGHWPQWEKPERVPARPPRLPAARQGTGMSTVWSRAGEGADMSEIVGLVGMSHSPFATLLPPDGPRAPGGRFLADAARVAAAVARLAPDAVVVIGPDHFHANFYDVMPPFVLGVEEAVGVRRLRQPVGPLPVAIASWPGRSATA